MCWKRLDLRFEHHTNHEKGNPCTVKFFWFSFRLQGHELTTSRSTYIMPFLIYQEATKSKPCSRPMSLSSPSLSAPPPPPPPGGSSREGSTNRPDHMYVSAHGGLRSTNGDWPAQKLQAWAKVTTIPYVTKWQQFHTWQSDNNSSVIVRHLCRSKTSFASDNQRDVHYKTLSRVATAGPAPYCSLLGGFPQTSPANHHRDHCVQWVSWGTRQYFVHPIPPITTRKIWLLNLRSEINEAF